jgi:hypothetical protein
MKVKGKLAQMLLQADPQVYAPFVTGENGSAVIYSEILKALYGMIKSPLLFYRKLRKDLESIGFTVNPYDTCVANKIVKNKQLTVAFHVDDLKVSHVDPKAVDDFVAWIKEVYENPEKKKITPSRGKVHDYLGMTLDFSIPGKVKLMMKDYRNKNVGGVSIFGTGQDTQECGDTSSGALVSSERRSNEVGVQGGCGISHHSSQGAILTQESTAGSTTHHSLPLHKSAGTG